VRRTVVETGAEVRAPARMRRLSSFSCAGWLLHAKLTSWGYLGLTLGDRNCCSQILVEDSPTGANALAAHSLF
jgi:hypothetical protein